MTEIKNMLPGEAWELLENDPFAVLIDVRSKHERIFVGYPLGSVSIPWKEVPEWEINSNFIAYVNDTVVKKDRAVLLICRSGTRSMEAAQKLVEADFTNLINIQEGFEGPLNDQKHRGTLGGWRFNRLPWEQS